MEQSKMYCFKCKTVNSKYGFGNNGKIYCNKCREIIGISIKMCYK